MTLKILNFHPTARHGFNRRKRFLLRDLLLQRPRCCCEYAGTTFA